MSGQTLFERFEVHNKEEAEAPAKRESGSVGHATLLFSKTHEGKRTHGSKNRRIPSGFASPVAMHHAAKGSMIVNLRNGGNF